MLRRAPLLGLRKLGDALLLERLLHRHLNRVTRQRRAGSAAEYSEWQRRSPGRPRGSGGRRSYPQQLSVPVKRIPAGEVGAEVRKQPQPDTPALAIVHLAKQREPPWRSAALLIRQRVARNEPWPSLDQRLDVHALEEPRAYCRRADDCRGDVAAHRAASSG